jgi:hypothetical protein
LNLLSVLHLLVVLEPLVLLLPELGLLQSWRSRLSERHSAARWIVRTR